jgi:hypothetical protein
MLTDSLDDANPSERLDGIRAGHGMALALLGVSENVRVVFFTDYGTSKGMELAREAYFVAGFNDRVDVVEIGKL